MNIYPTADRILVQYDDAETISSGGLIIPDSAREYQWEGTVIAVGPGFYDAKGRFHATTEICVGDRVLLEPGKGTKLISADTERLLMLRACEIVAVLG